MHEWLLSGSIDTNGEAMTCLVACRAIEEDTIMALIEIA